MASLENLLNKISQKTYAVSIMLTIGVTSMATLIGLNIFGLPVTINNQKISMQNIFLHNIVISLILILSVFTFGIISNLLLIYNFFVFGVKTRALLEQYGLDALTHKVLIHGVFEIPVMILTGAVGSYLLVQKITKESIKINFKLFKLMIKIFIIAIILSAIAAYIEVNFSMK
ncbi:MAG: stage II sporulation protein M [Lactobacillaceae bacterium]|jgi:uncharacterized membrane protein SpoIIM required for sporulation|nr:stage II sporulation protein M [Lactobacillaceae bacterium]